MRNQLHITYAETSAKLHRTHLSKEDTFSSSQWSVDDLIKDPNVDNSHVADCKTQNTISGTFDLRSRKAMVLLNSRSTTSY